MTKATSKMLALLLSFAMVFSFIGWLSVSEVSADSNDVLVDARIPDVYAGWAVDGNEVGGHLEGAVNFAAQWVDESVYPTNQTRYLTREEGLTMALADSGITADKSVTVYDTNGKDAQVVADFFKSKGITNVTTVTKTADEMKASTLVSYPNYHLYVPAEVVKNIADYKAGKAELSDNAKSIVGDRNIRIFHAEYCAAGKYTSEGYMENNPINWDAKDGDGNYVSAYYGTGHVPGAEPISTDDFEPERYGDRDIIDNADEGITWKADYLLRDDDELIDLADQYGLKKDEFVVVAGYEPMATTKIALTMKYLGVDNVYVMSSAYTGWNQNGYDLEKEVWNKSTAGTDITAIGNPDLIDSQDEAAAMINKEGYQLVDTRRVEEWEGKTSGYGYHDVAGRLKGDNIVNSPSGVGDSSSMYYYRNPDSSMRSPEVLEAMWATQGVDSTKHLSFFCGSGWRAAEQTWDAWVMGLDASLYNDGWQGWSNAERPFLDKDGNFVRVHGSDIVSADYVSNITAEDWAKLGIDKADLKSSDILLDVRPAAMYEVGHLAGSTNIPVSNGYTAEQKEAVAKFYDANASKGRIVIVCVSGNMLAKNTLAALQDSGKNLSNVTYLIGGANGVQEDWVVESAGSTYKVVSENAKTIALVKAANKSSVTVPATVKVGENTYKVRTISASAFKSSKAKTVTIKTKNLSKKSVKNSLKSSKVKTVKVKVGSKKVNKKYVKKYKKYFTKKNAGRTVKVK